MDLEQLWGGHTYTTWRILWLRYSAALWFFWVRIILISVVIYGADNKFIGSFSTVPSCARVSPMLAFAPVPISNDGIGVNRTFRRFYNCNGLARQGVDEVCRGSFADLIGHQRDWCPWHCCIRRMLGEFITKNVQLKNGLGVEGWRPTPVPIYQSRIKRTSDSDLFGNIQVIHAYPRTLLRFSYVSAPFGFPCQGIGRFGLREGPVGLILSLNSEFVRVDTPFLYFLKSLRSGISGRFCCLSALVGNNSLPNTNSSAEHTGDDQPECKASNSLARRILYFLIFGIPFFGFCTLLFKFLDSAFQKNGFAFIAMTILILALALIGQVITYLAIREILSL
jgi:hypothetical protein